MSPRNLGYDINTGEPILTRAETLVHIGGGVYKKRNELTGEDIKRRKRWNNSVDSELLKFKLGLEES